ncbi:type II secretion system protein [Arthrobacter sp. MYb227]|uniref:type II secretion system F family protein n=1 Tax=Arthrobacter sp. MYb227 TaxID=1848601 RepID=UPI000CFDEC5B|nr:type II secretion system F family protein [Arthrobacter sp. MYb227]PQZ96300.1 type II secretion system protein [Arthrobacter sp. MYb227]
MIFYLLAGILAGLAIWLWGSPSPSRAVAPSQELSGGGTVEHLEPLPLVLEMCATLLETGLPVRSVLEVIGEHVPGYKPLTKVARALELNVSWERAWAQLPPNIQALEPSLRFTQMSGAPAAKLLRSAAQTERTRGLRQAEARGSEFGIKLVIPLGLCALPAFVCLGIIPIVISLLPDF